MANVLLGLNQPEAIDFGAPPWWRAPYQVYATAQAYAVYDDSRLLGFTGRFTYDGQGKPSGTASTVDFETFDGSVCEITGVTLSMTTVQGYIDNPNGGPAFMAYLLSGSDLITVLDAGNEAHDRAGNTVLGYAGNDLIRYGVLAGRADGGSGTDTLDFQAVPDHRIQASLQTGRATDLSTGGVLSFSGFEHLTGGSADDLLQGNAAANRIDGAGGALDLVSYAATTTAVLVNLSTGRSSGGGGADTLVSIEGALGGSAADRLIGNAAANWLEGGAGADTLEGGLGNDTLVADANDVLVEAADGGVDTVRTASHHVLGTHLENLTLLGTASYSGTGNALANRIEGNEGNNRLDGGAGRDTLVGGLGNDTYVVELGDTIIETPGAGWDTVVAAYSLTLANGLEHLTLTGSADLNGVGNSETNELRGNDGDNVLDGKLNSDTMYGGLGDDIYVVGVQVDYCFEAANAGHDLIRCEAARYYMGPNIEDLVSVGSGAHEVIGNGLGNRITGQAGADTLDGGAGTDTLVGGAGNDLYRVDRATDVIIESAGGGIDEVSVTSSSYTLGAHIENARVSPYGQTQCLLVGNELDNLLVSNAGHETLNGGAGADTMQGGYYDDVYVVDNVGDRVIEADVVGVDEVRSSVSLTLSDNVEIGRLVGTASLSLSGNGLANELYGNDGHNLLAGGTGMDTIDGGGGNDTASYATAGAGVQVDLGLGSTLGAEQDTLIDIEAVIGSRFADTLRGGDGVDTLTGGTGADRFQFDNLAAADVLTDFVHGSDQLQIVQSGLRIGDGDVQVDGAVTIATPGGHAAAAELVIASTALAGSITASAVAAAIGPATSAYEVGQTSLFVVHNATDSAVYLFTSAGHDANISTGELTRLVWLSQQTALSTSDFGFVS